MNCVDIDRQMDALLDGGLDEQAERTIKAHLSFCPTCKSRWEQLKGLRALLQGVATSVPSESLESRVMSAYYKKHESATSVRVKWRALLLPLGIPKPAFAIILLSMMVAALMGAFLLGRVTATQIVIPAPPTLTVSSVSSPPLKTPESGVERRESALLRTGALRHRSRRPVHRTANVESVARTSRVNPFESFATVSPSGTNYSTRASLDGFEPLKDTKIRIVKGEEQR